MATLDYFNDNKDYDKRQKEIEAWRKDIDNALKRCLETGSLDDTYLGRKGKINRQRILDIVKGTDWEVKFYRKYNPSFDPQEDYGHGNDEPRDESWWDVYKLMGADKQFKGI